jgi:hypothetical protein
LALLIAHVLEGLINLSKMFLRERINNGMHRKNRNHRSKRECVGRAAAKKDGGGANRPVWVVRSFLVAALLLTGCGTGWRMDYGEPAAQFLSANVTMQGAKYLGEKVTVQGIVTEVLPDQADGSWVYLDNGIRCNLGDFRAMAEGVKVGETILIDGILRKCSDGDVLLDPALLRDPTAPFQPLQ